MPGKRVPSNRDVAKEVLKFSTESCNLNMYKQLYLWYLIKVEKELRFRWVNQANLKIVSSEGIIWRIIELVAKRYDIKGEKGKKLAQKKRPEKRPTGKYLNVSIVSVHPFISVFYAFPCYTSCSLNVISCVLSALLKAIHWVRWTLPLSRGSCIRKNHAWVYKGIFGCCGGHWAA